MKSDVGDLEISAITEADIPAVAEFFHRGLSSHAPVADWCRTMTPVWDVERPNHGYLLRENGRIVGAYHAFYSRRMVDGRPRHICNLGAWSVVDEHRAAGLRMLRSLLRQRGYTFTDLTPSGSVPALNARLGFTALDTATALVLNVPWPVRPRGVRVVDCPAEIDQLLSGQILQIYRDHAATIAHHAVLVSGDRVCYVLYRRDTLKHLPVFASILHVSDREVFRNCAAHFYRYLLLRHRIVATLVELRVVGHRPARSVMIPGRSKMYLSDELGPDHIDYLYSELTCRPW